jgi:thioredoxin reductase (NADPH)
MVWDMVVIGAGPGGLQAAIAAGSEGMKVLVLERATVGGQIGQTPLLENSVFAAGGITGPAFAEMMKAQALAMGVTIQKADCTGVTVQPGNVKVLRLVGPNGKASSVKGHTVVIAVGAKWQELDIPGVRGQSGKHVFFGPVKSIGYNATGRDVAVYGGGPAAGQAILALAQQVNTRKVHVLMRSTLRMPQYLVDRIHAAERAGRVSLYNHTTIREVQRWGDDEVRISTDTQLFTVDALFMCNGLLPATDWLRSTLTLDEDGRIVVTDGVVTELPGVFAIGDCRSGSTARVGVAIGDGSLAVTHAWQYFASNPVCSMCPQLFAKAV